MTENGQGEQRSARDRILDAAEVLFAEHGFDRTSTARLARQAGVPQGLIFYHFGTKLGLLLSLVRERAAAATSALLPGSPGGDPHRAVAELWRSLRAHLGRPSPMHRIVRREMEHHPELRDYAHQLEHDIVDHVARHLAAVGGRPGGPTPEQRVAARLLTRAAAVADLPDSDGDPDVTPELVARVIIDGIG